MPVEFSAAAYRLGHSMVRQRYPHNRVFNDPAGLQPVLHCSRACRATSSATSRPAVAASRRCRRTGSSTGGASTTSAPAAARRHRNAVAQARSLPGGVAAQPAGRRRQSRVPQSQARRQARPAVGSGRGQAHEGQEPADARRDRVRQQRLDRRRRRQGSRACIPRRRSGTTSSRKPRSGTTACGSDRSARPSSRKCSSASCTATTIPSCGGSRTGSRRCRRRRRALHHGGPAALRGRHQSARRLTPVRERTILARAPASAGLAFSFERHARVVAPRHVAPPRPALHSRHNNAGTSRRTGRRPMRWFDDQVMPARRVRWRVCARSRRSRRRRRKPTRRNRCASSAPSPPAAAPTCWRAASRGNSPSSGVSRSWSRTAPAPTRRSAPSMSRSRRATVTR